MERVPSNKHFSSNTVFCAKGLRLRKREWGEFEQCLGELCPEEVPEHCPNGLRKLTDEEKED